MIRTQLALVEDRTFSNVTLDFCLWEAKRKKNYRRLIRGKIEEGGSEKSFSFREPKCNCAKEETPKIGEQSPSVRRDCSVVVQNDDDGRSEFSGSGRFECYEALPLSRPKSFRSSSR